MKQNILITALLAAMLALAGCGGGAANGIHLRKFGINDGHGLIMPSWSGWRLVVLQICVCYSGIDRQDVSISAHTSVRDGPWQGIH